MITISTIRHMYPENAGFFIDRKEGHRNWSFLHFHQSVEIFLEGKMIVTEPHAVILFRPGTPQYFITRENLIHDWFHFHTEDGEMPPISLFQPDRIHYPSCHKEITRWVAELETEFFASGFSSDILIDSKIKELLIRLERNLSAGAAPSRIKNETLEKFRFLRGELFSSTEKHPSVSEMAEKVNLSPSRFFALYKSIFGTSPTADLIHARVRSAKNMLIYTDKRIDDIAFSLGYENTTHFIRQFKSRTGKTPSEYRLLSFGEKSDTPRGQGRLIGLAEPSPAGKQAKKASD